MIFLILLGAVGCSQKESKQGLLTAGPVSFELSGAWESHGENRWSQGMGHSLMLLDLAPHSSTIGREGIQKAQASFEKKDQEGGLEALKDTELTLKRHPHNLSDSPEREFTERIKEIRERLESGASPERVQPQLVSLLADLDLLTEDLEGRARRYATIWTKQTNDRLEFEGIEPIEVAGQAAYLVVCKNQRGEPASYLYWSEAEGDAVFLSTRGGGDGTLLAGLAPTIRHGGSYEPGQSRTKGRSYGSRIPPWVYPLLFVFVFCSIPAALSASVAYSNPEAGKRDYERHILRATSGPVRLCTLGGCAAFAVYLLYEVMNNGGGFTSAMSGIVFIGAIIFLAVFSLLTAFLAGRFAGWGAVRGSRRGKLSCVMGAAFYSMCGAAFLPVLMSLAC